MCGIVGAAAAWLSDAERERFRELMIVSNLRGYRGAGIIKSSNTGRFIETYKTTGTGIDVAYGAEFNKDIVKNGTPSILIGHTRYPTKGAVTLEATHPHVHDGIYGVHNGTIDSIDGKWIGKDESDSALLYKMISEYGVKQVLPTVRGAYALVWVDEADKTLNFIRNDKRPLYLAVLKSGAAMFWASEASMLHFVLGRAGWQYDLQALATDQLLTFDMPLSGNLNNSPRSVEELKGAAPAVAVTAPFRNSQSTSAGSSAVKQQGETSSSQSSEAGKEGAKKAATGATSTLYAPNKPKMTWCLKTNAWVPKDKPKTLKLTWDALTNSYVEPRTPDSTTSNATGTGSALTATSSTVTTPGPTNTAVVPYTNPALKEKVRSETFRAFLDEMFDESRPADDPEEEEQQVGYAISPGPYIETTRNNFVSMRVFQKYLNKGCVWCGSPGDIDCQDALQWVAEDEFVCPDCTADEYTVDYINSTYPQADIAHKAA